MAILVRNLGEIPLAGLDSDVGQHRFEFILQPHGVGLPVRERPMVASRLAVPGIDGPR